MTQRNVIKTKCKKMALVIAIFVCGYLCLHYTGMRVRKTYLFADVDDSIILLEYPEIEITEKDKEWLDAIVQLEETQKVFASTENVRREFHLSDTDLDGFYQFPRNNCSISVGKELSEGADDYEYMFVTFESLMRDNKILKYVFSTPKWEVNKLFLIVTTVFLFYLCYSFYIGSNVKSAILTDFVVQYKPYLGFFCVYAIKPEIPGRYRKLVREVCLVLGVYLALVGIGCLISYESLEYTFKHPSRLATAVSVVALLYLYCSDYTTKDKLIFILLMIIGLTSGRSKFYGFFIICAAMVLFVRSSFKLKLNVKNVVFILFDLCIS